MPKISEVGDDYSWVIGLPLREVFRQLIGKSAEDSLIERLVDAYRERYEAVGIYESSLYSGVEEMLIGLSNERKDRKLVIATSKPTVYATRIVNHFGLGDFFDLIVGSELDGRMTGKDELIKHVIGYYDRDLASYVMIGDRMHDIMGARKAGIDSIGVLYGYGKESEIVSAGPNFIVRSVQELGSLLHDM
jgi:phosphoglycolate phosphatase